MPKGLIFFCCSCCILILTILNINIGPIVSGTVGGKWGRKNCVLEEDRYDNAKKTNIDDKNKKYIYEWNIDECKIKKGMYDLEYTAFIIDIVIGFVCGIIGLIHLFDGGKEHVSKTGIVGLGLGIVGFILTFVYVIFNGLVYTKYYDDEGYLYKRDSNGAYAEWEVNKGYKCIYYDEQGNNHALIAKYSDLNKKQYNYDKDLVLKRSSEVRSCTKNYFEDQNFEDCYNTGYFQPSDGSTPVMDDTCQKLYLSAETEYTSKDKSDRFLTALILSLFVCLANVGLAVFGFLLFKNPSDFAKMEEVKN